MDSKVSITKLIFVLFVVLGLVIPSHSFMTTVDATKEECFYEDIPQGAPVNVMFQVISGGFLDIDLRIQAPDQRIIYEGTRESEGKYTFNTYSAGVYSFCFSNRMSTLTPKVVSFLITVDGGVRRDIAKKADFTPLEASINQLSEAISAVVAEQEYMRLREMAHRNTSESTNARVMWWSIFEALMLVAMSVWQVYYLRRFFEVKRVA
eukprot:TRINITY_DN403_c0_g1_i2.p1 TRINITY_DN403_c0_g1~~TRINITY_DN403_c0_g1_i2.p1  ORF type:complete len:207 (+),score=42.19 TRINITY_DN403_c0_g1_i2:192-812(+)